MLEYINRFRKTASLAVFRILFGLLMCFSMIRFWWNGWIEKLYLEPSFHFHYHGFEFVQVPGQFTYLIFFLSALTALFIALGIKYRISIIFFFLSFTYIELMDKSTYLNHYYFVSIVSFIMIFLPMHRYFSIDAKINPTIKRGEVPAWTVDILKFILVLVYFYAGIAKINQDWLIEALPLAIWLPSKVGIPLIGNLLNYDWVHYLFSWGGMIYDITIPFLLLSKRFRNIGFVFVVIFHVLTRILFPIGMFPFIMIASTLIFFDGKVHERIIDTFAAFLRMEKSSYRSHTRLKVNNSILQKIRTSILVICIAFQILLPLRYLLYPGNIFWTEEGYRFSWRVMLMEKTGYANFKVVNAVTGKRFYVQNDDFLTSFQEKQMSTQPDFILEYAHFLGAHFSAQGHENLEIYVESYAALNGRSSQPFIDPEVDLLEIRDSFKPKTFILPLNE